MERMIRRRQRQRQDADANANCTVVTEDEDSGNTIHPARGRDGTNDRSDDEYEQGR